MLDDTVPPDPREPRVLRIPAVRRTLHDIGAQVTFDPPVTPASIAAAKVARDQELAEVQAVLDAYELEKFRALNQLEAMLQRFGYARTLSLLDMKAAQMGIDR